MFIFISHLNNVLALGIFHQVMKHHPMRVCDVAPICNAPHSKGIKPVIYTGVIRVVEGLPFLCTRRCSASGLEMRFICKINKEQAPTLCFFPSSHQTRSDTHTNMHSFNSICPPLRTHTHKHRQVYYEIREKTFLIKMIVCTLMKICLVNDSLQEATSLWAPTVRLRCRPAPVHTSACDHHTTLRNQISTYHKVIVQCKFTCCFLLSCFEGKDDLILTRFSF